MQESKRQLVSLSLNSQPGCLQRLRCAVRDSADLAGLDEDDTHAVVLAVNEACMNIIQHGYQMDPSGRIDISVVEEPGALVFRLRDYASSFELDRIEPRDLDEVHPGGLGIHFILSLMDECRLVDTPDGRGNLLQMKKILHKKRQ